MVQSHLALLDPTLHILCRVLDIILHHKDFTEALAMYPNSPECELLPNINSAPYSWRRKNIAVFKTGPYYFYSLVFCSGVEEGSWLTAKEEVISSRISEGVFSAGQFRCSVSSWRRGVPWKSPEDGTGHSPGPLQAPWNYVQDVFNFYLDVRGMKQIY